MKTLAVVLMLCLVGCAPTIIHEYTMDRPMEATVGSKMMAWGVIAAGGSTNIFSKGGVRKELLYSGITENTIKISYREFYVDEISSTLARPAFTQDLTYDLDQTRDITFQEIQLNVISADGSKIVYKVVTGPGSAPKTEDGKTPIRW